MMLSFKNCELETLYTAVSINKEYRYTNTTSQQMNTIVMRFSAEHQQIVAGGKVSRQIRKHL